jgi:hypothetical protein
LLAALDVTTGEVPHVREPQPARRSVTKQDMVCPSQNRGDDPVTLHRPSMRTSGEGRAARHYLSGTI